MAGSPWICPRCGTAANADACPNCLHERPFANGSANAPGGYFSIVQGPQGYAGMPRAFGVGCLLLLIASFLLPFLSHLRR